MSKKTLTEAQTENIKMRSEVKLKPCPFCGGEAEIRTATEPYLLNKVYAIHCSKCHSTSDYKRDKEVAIELWNTRKPIDRIVEQLEEAGKYHLELSEVNKLDVRESHRHKSFAAVYGNAIEIVNELAGEMGVAKNAITTWIPCSERLPEHGGVYIVMIEGARKPTTLKLNIDGWADEFDNLYKVIAWMPMPPAYVPKGE